MTRLPNMMREVDQPSLAEHAALLAFWGTAWCSDLYRLPILNTCENTPGSKIILSRRPPAATDVDRSWDCNLIAQRDLETLRSQASERL